MRLWLRKIQKTGGGESVYINGIGEIRDINWLWVFPGVIPKANIIENVFIFCAGMQ